MAATGYVWIAAAKSTSKGCSRNLPRCAASIASGFTKEITPTLRSRSSSSALTAWDAEDVEETKSWKAMIRLRFGPGAETLSFAVDEYMTQVNRTGACTAIAGDPPVPRSTQ
jgi:hypothetical protein